MGPAGTGAVINSGAASAGVAAMASMVGLLRAADAALWADRLDAQALAVAVVPGLGRVAAAVLAQDLAAVAGQVAGSAAVAAQVVAAAVVLAVAVVVTAGVAAAEATAVAAVAVTKPVFA